MLNNALGLHQSGQLVEAQAAYKTILDHFPDQPDTLHLLGVLQHQNGDPTAAAALIEKSIRLAPDFGPAHANLGNVYKDLGRPQEAAESLMRAIDLDPRNPAIRTNLSRIFGEMGHWDDAAAAAMDALNMSPGDGQALINLADMLEGGGKTEDARKVLDQGTAQRPDDADLQAAMGNFLLRRGEAPGAIKHLTAAVRSDPENALHHNALGLALNSLTLSDQALHCFETAARLNPNAAEAWVNLANAHRAGGALGQAEIAYREALRAHPNLVAASGQLGTMLLLSFANAEAALPYLKSAAEASAPDSPHHSAYLMALHYADAVSAGDIATAHKDYGMAFPDPPRPSPISRAPGSPMRVGLVSGDYRRHATGFFLPPLLRERDPSVWSALLYSNTQTPDSQTGIFRQLADDFIDISSLDDDDAAARIRADNLDILIDLNGHTWGNRLPVLARRPAPIQAAWLDYVGSTGLAQVDAVLVDGHHVPPSQEDQYRETVLRFKENLFCYDPPMDAPAPTPPPCLKQGTITFGCFNAAFKITPRTIALWSQILRALPDSRMVLRSPPFQYEETIERFRALFRSHEIDPARIEFHGPATNAEVLAAYGALDLVLDSHPYSGGLTTLEALWMGVPVVTMPGDRMAANHSAAHLRTMGRAELVADDEDDFVQIAHALARDTDHLVHLHQNLRAEMDASPMTNAVAYARDFERLLSHLIQAV
ncbi:putative GT41 : related to UDP-GlcNAc : protein O-b-N-acetylglucosaminyltransferase [Magnetospira sp. QH-2]|nr:putative GT41 : related to UDP-GlcNAc : protein O-b-N-acetylglucosaminyltransferase [Magnetospira sp. QH-2]